MLAADPMTMLLVHLQTSNNNKRGGFGDTLTQSCSRPNLTLLKVTLIHILAHLTCL